MTGLPEARRIDLAHEPGFVLGGCEVRPSSREVLMGGQAIFVEPRVMQVLVALARRRGEVVTRDELTELCWGGVVVGEGAVHRSLSRIRRLTEGMKDVTLETIPRVGYRLSAMDQGPALAPGSGSTKRRARRRRLIALAAMLAILGLAAAYMLARDRTPTNVPAAPAISTASGITLAVLPFADMSNDRSQGYFAIGLTDELVTALSRIGALRVVSTGAGLPEGADLRQTGRALGVRYILKGGVQRAGLRIRINVQLVDASSGARLWAQSYDRVAADVFAVQDDIVTRVASEIRPQLYNAARRAIESRPTRSFSAWELFLRATWTPGQDEDVGGDEQLALARRAIAIDPGYGAPHALIAGDIGYAANLDPAWDTPRLWAEAARHADQALSLAPNDSDALLNLLSYYFGTGNLREGVNIARRMVELDPNDVIGRATAIGGPYACSPVPQAAIDQLTALNAGLSPDNPVRGQIFFFLGQAYLNNRDFRRAAEAAGMSDQIHGEAMNSYNLAAALLALGDRRRAVAVVRERLASWPTLSPRHQAEIAIPRRCGGGPNSAYLQGLFRNLADAVEADAAAQGRASGARGRPPGAARR
jgi:TolB-like protein/DNA-binding winged helix-turn-helix (wHTH) protein